MLPPCRFERWTCFKMRCGSVVRNAGRSSTWPSPNLRRIRNSWQSSQFMTMTPQFTDEETALMADQQFFRAKANIMAKVRHMLSATHATLKEEVGFASLVIPPDFDITSCQFVKGEHLEFFPYQYLDFPKHFHDSNAFTFRTLFWWGHHVTCALLLEGGGGLYVADHPQSKSTDRRCSGRTVLCEDCPTPALHRFKDAIWSCAGIQ